MKKPRSLRKKGLFFLPLIAIAAGIFYWWYHPAQPNIATDNGTQPAEHNKKGPHRPLAPVQAATAQLRSVPQYLSGLGTVTAANTVTLRSRVNGELIAIHFQEGQQVKAGQLLAEIDPRPYQVALTQAQGQLAKDRATLANARRDLSRYEKLAKNRLISQQDLDSKRSLVEETLGTIKADEGNVASAQLNLTYSRITSPIDGRIGLKQVDPGNYITSSDTNGLVVITQVQPINIVFSVAENTISQILRAQKSGQPLLVEAWDRSNSQLLAQGTLLSLDNQIDVTTGTIKLKARFDNQDSSLFPNQFVNARLKVNTLQDAVIIPNAALQMGNEGHFVWVVNSENKVSKKAVSTGTQDNQNVVITAGLETGERIVTDGLDRLTEGAKVEIVAPQSSPLPQRRDSLPVKGERR